MIGVLVQPRRPVMTSVPSDVGQAEVEDDDVRRSSVGGPQRRAPSGGEQDGVAVGGEVDPQRAQELGVVVDDQDPVSSTR